MKTHMLKIIILETLLLFSQSILVTQAFSAITFTGGKWETTFNCTERTEPTSMSTCDGLGAYGAGTATFIAAGNSTQITSAANNPAGGGGNGFRMWYGDGTNIQSSPVTLNFSSTNQLWVRFYIRYQSGFKFSYDYNGVAWSPSYHKWLYFRSPTNTGWEVFEPASGNEFRIIQGGTDITTARASDAVGNNLNWGWKNLFPSNHGIADGSWHYAEMYLDNVNNKARIWIDGDLRAQGGTTGGPWAQFNFLSNMTSPINGGPAYVDVDDMVIYITTPPNKDSYGNPYIGPIGGASLATALPVNGACGSANGQSFTSLTSASPNLCSAGTVASFAGSGPWTWGCSGLHGGTSTLSTACSASLTAASSTPSVTTPSTVLFSESFEDSSYASRGWYDNTNHGTIASGGQSGNCLQWAWTGGSTKPTNGGSMRMKFTPSDSLYLSYYVKFQTGWRGSGANYHPHLIYILSDLDSAASAYSPLANNYLDTYLEFLADTTSPFAIRPQIAIQDQKRVNTSYGTPPNNLSATTENRSVAYCNTPVSANTMGTCYADAPYYSANTWKASTASLSTNAWHKVEVYLKMNSISGGKGISDGIMQEWIDGTLVINQNDVLYRTNQDATKKWAQFVFAPYMSPPGGSPISQTMWIDELKVMTAPPISSSLTPPAGLTIKSITP